MSLQQIVQEFPFLRSYTKEDLWEGAIVEGRVSRLSLEALQLTLEDIPFEKSFSSLFHEVEIFNKTGEAIPEFPSFGFSICGFFTLGDALWKMFQNEKEWAAEVNYVVYIIDHDVKKWRRYLGKNKLYSKTYRREIVLFKMPKTKSLWQLLQKYYKSKR